MLLTQTFAMLEACPPQLSDQPSVSSKGGSATMLHVNLVASLIERLECRLAPG